jgi:hypothetical protein
MRPNDERDQVPADQRPRGGWDDFDAARARFRARLLSARAYRTFERGTFRLPARDRPDAMRQDDANGVPGARDPRPLR